LLDRKPFLEDTDNPNVLLTESQWRNVSQLEAVLAHPSAVAKKLQAENSTPGTFLWEWKNLIFYLSRAGGLISEGIVFSVKKRVYFKYEDFCLPLDMSLFAHQSIIIPKKNRVLKL
jgi:hypothetical protein